MPRQNCIILLHAQAVHSVEVLADRPAGTATVAADNSGDTLANQVVLMHETPANARVNMRMCIYEARTDCHTSSVDFVGRSGVAQITDSRNQTRFDAYIAEIAISTGAIENRRVPDEYVEIHAEILLTGLRLSEQDTCQRTALCHA